MSILRWTGLLVGAALCGLFGLGILFTPGLVEELPSVPSLIVLLLGIVCVACSFFAPWIQLFIGGRSGARLLLVGGASALLFWVLLWGVFPLIDG